MKAGNTSLHISVNAPLVRAVKVYVEGNPRKGRRNISQLTENLWISYLRGKGVKLPALLKNGRAAK